MRRLRDLLDSVDPAVAELARLVLAVGDLEPTHGAQGRVREAIAARRRSRPSSCKSALVALILGLGLSAAIAAVKLAQPREPAPGSAQYRLVDPPTSTARSAPDEHSQPALELVPPVPPELILPAPEEPIRPRVRSFAAPASPRIDPSPAARSAPRPARPAEPSMLDPAGPAATLTAEPPAPASAGSPPTPPHESTQAALTMSARTVAKITRPNVEESVLVHSALRALRSQHDVHAALRQLEAYRRRFPSGDLAEEALALSIEALAALGDRAGVALADEYLQRFPDGRFRDAAERAQRRFRGHP